MKLYNTGKFSPWEKLQFCWWAALAGMSLAYPLIYGVPSYFHWLLYPVMLAWSLWEMRVLLLQLPPPHKD